MSLCFAVTESYNSGSLRLRHFEDKFYEHWCCRLENKTTKLETALLILENVDSELLRYKFSITNWEEIHFRHLVNEFCTSKALSDVSRLALAFAHIRWNTRSSGFSKLDVHFVPRNFQLIDFKELLNKYFPRRWRVFKSGIIWRTSSHNNLLLKPFQNGSESKIFGLYEEKSHKTQKKSIFQLLSVITSN